MATVLVTKGKIIEDSAVALLARIVGIDGIPILQADITSMILRVFDKASGNLVVPEGESETDYDGTDLDIEEVVFDGEGTDMTLPTDVRWDIDDIGRNVAINLHGSHFAEGDKTYRAELTITPVSGDPYVVIWELKTENIFSA